MVNKLISSNQSSFKWQEIGHINLQDAMAKIEGDPPSAIPFLVRLLENPSSPFALPGKIDLYNHDCFHLLLEQAQKPYNEAFVIGFTMGNDDQVKNFHVQILKFFAQYLYPKKYQLTKKDFLFFDLGYSYGKRLIFRNINTIDLRASVYQKLSINQLRINFGINISTIKQKMKSLEN
ncbi:MAG: hypothetical protein QNJ64_05670 [Crocosphaera sp.]|nr:hypothetical protein [Crocosphaera sp.]